MQINSPVSVFTRKSTHAAVLASLVLMGCGGGAETATGATPTVSALQTPSSSAATSTPTPTPSPAAAQGPTPTPVVTTPVVTAPAVVTTTGTSSAVSVALSANRVSGVAPLSVFFDATGTTSPVTSMPFHEIKYSWVFGDPAGNAGWSYGSRVGQSSKNEAYGAVAGHVFETPGTYTVTVSAFDGANTNSKTTTITVTDPNVVYGGANTICVANGSTPTPGANGCPSGALGQNITSYADIVALTYNGNKRILLRRGDQWDVNSYTNTKGANIIIGAYGSGTAPVIRTISANYAFQLVSGVSNWTMMDVKFLGGPGGSNPVIATSGTGLSNLTMLRLQFDLSGGIAFSDVDGLFVVDCNGANYRGGTGYVGIYSQFSSRVALLGNRVYDATQIEHNIRMQGNYKAVISNNTLYGPAPTKQAITIRGRSNQSTGHIEVWSGVWAEHIMVSDNDIDAGPNSGQLVEFAPQNPLANEPVRDVIFERNNVHGSVGTLIVTEASERATIRNNILMSSDTNKYASAVISVLYKNTAGVPPPSSTYIYNNSFYRPSGATPYFEAIVIDRQQQGGLPSSGLPTGTVIKNNLVYAPYSTGNDYVASGGPILIGSYLSASRTVANNSSDLQIKNTAPGFVTPPVSTTDWKPSGGYAIGGGTSVPVWDDFFLKPQTSSRSLGAVLP